MSQMHELCLLDYRFAILDTAYLIHKPGIKRKKLHTVQSADEKWRTPFVKANDKVYVQLMRDFKTKYGNKKTKCQEHFHKKKVTVEPPKAKVRSKGQ